MDENRFKELNEKVGAFSAGTQAVDTSFNYGIDIPDNVTVATNNIGSAFDNSLSNDFNQQTGAYSLSDAMAEGENIIKLKEEAKKTNAWKKYMYSKEEVLQEVRIISTETGIPESALLSSSENLDKGRGVYSYKKKLEKLNQESGKPFDLQKLYEAYPELGKIAAKSESDAAIALHNLQNVKETKGIVEAAKAGWEMFELSGERGRLGYAALNGAVLDDKQLARIEEIDQRMHDMPQIPGLLDSPMEAIVGGTVQTGGLMVRGLLSGQKMGAYGAGFGALIGAIGGGATTLGAGAVPGAVAGARIGYSIGTRVGAAEDMYNEIAGNNYLDFKKYRGKDGKQLLSDNEARKYAAAAAAIETGIEFYNVDQVLGVVKGAVNENGIKAIVAAAKDNSELKSMLTAYVKNGIKNIGEVAVTESTEEGVQEASNRIISNIMAANHVGGNIPEYSFEDIIGGALQASWEALPASIGLGAAAHGAGSVDLARRAAAVFSLRDEKRKADFKNMNGINMLRKLRDYFANNEFVKKNPELAQNVLEEQLTDSGLKNVSVDTDMVLNQEGGYELLKEVAAKAGIDEEQFNQIVEERIDMQIPTAVYAQQVMPGEAGEKLENYITFDSMGECLARSRQYAARVRRMQDEIMSLDSKRREEAMNTYLDSNFKNDKEREVVEAVLMRYPDDPAAGVQELRKQLQGKIDAMLEPCLDTMRQGMGNGTAVIFTDDNHQPTTQEYASGGYRVSNNDMWYSKWYKDYGYAPSKQQMRDIAIENLTGESKYIVPGYEYQPGMERFYEENKAQLAAINESLERLNALAPRLEKINPGDLTITEGLSTEGFEVYKDVLSKLQQGPSKQARMAARMNAILFARMADRMAELHKEMGQKKYTALDFYNSVQLDATGNAGVGVGYRQDGIEKLSYEENQQAIKDYFSKVNIEDLPLINIKEISDDLKNKSSEELLEIAVGKVKSLSNKKIIDATGKTLYFHPGSTEDIKQYTIHFIAGKDKTVEDVTAGRLLGLMTLEDTITNPLVVLRQPDIVNSLTGEIMEGRKLYLNLYRDENNFCTQVVIGVNENEKGRVVTCYVSKDSKKHKNNALGEFKKRLVRAKSILYCGRQSEYPRHPTDRLVSTVDTHLHQPGNFILPQFYDEVKNQEVLEQRAYHGSPAAFNRFDVGFIGTAAGTNTHGWGLYFAKNKKAADGYKKALGKDAAASIYEVEVPENKDLLDEDKPFAQQHKGIQKRVLEAINALSNEQKQVFWDNLLLHKLERSKDTKAANAAYNENRRVYDAIDKLGSNAKLVFVLRGRENTLKNAGYSAEQIEAMKNSEELRQQEMAKYSPAVEEAKAALEAAEAEDARLHDDIIKQAIENPADVMDTSITGQRIYYGLSKALSNGNKEVSGDRRASEYLNEYGIKGITYNNGPDGRCFVVFDDKAVSIIERYNQAVNVKRDFEQRYEPVDLNLFIKNMIKKQTGNDVSNEELVAAVKTLKGSGETEEENQNAINYINEFLRSAEPVTTNDLLAVFDFSKMTDYDAQHVVLAKSQRGRKGKQSRVTRNVVIKKPSTLLQQAILVEVQPTNHSDRYYNVNHKDEELYNSYRFVIPVKIGSDIFTLVVTAVGTNENILQSLNEVRLYEIYEKKIPSSQRIASLKDDGIGNDFYESIPSTISLTEMLFKVKDLNGEQYVNQDTGEFNIADKFVISDNKYKQSAGETVATSALKGQTIIKGNGQRVIALFAAADQSTFMHEAAHLYLTELMELANMPNAPKHLLKDVETIKSWGEWQDGMMSEYKSTHLEESFAVLDKAIREAVVKGSAEYNGMQLDLATLKNIWLQERFARGFENYLKQGKAPTSALRQVFYRFKNWLCSIYKDFKKLGGAPSMEVSAVMDRMIATQDEIDIELKKRGVNDFVKHGGLDYLSDDSQALYNRMIERAREEAEANVLKVALKDVREDLAQQQEELYKQTEDDYRKQLEKEPVFIIQQHLENHAGLELSAMCEALGVSEEEYNKQMKEYGGSLDAAVDKFMDQFRAYIESQPTTDEEIQAMAEAKVQEDYYRKMVTALELNAFENIAAAQRKIVSKLVKALKEEPSQDVAKAMKALSSKEKAEAGLRAVRDAAEGHYRDYVNYVKSKLETMPLSDANNYRMWRRKSSQAQQQADMAMSKGEWEKAVNFKKQQLIYDLFADEAVKSRKYTEKLEQSLLRKQATMNKNNKIPADERYVFNHLLYAFGFTNKDVAVPPEYSGFTDTFMKRDETLEWPFVNENGTLNLPDWILSAGTGTEQRKAKHNDLTMDQLKDLAQLLKVIYKTGMESDKLRTATDIHGNSVGLLDAIGQIAREATERVLPKNNRDITGAEGMTTIEKALFAANAAHVSLLKPETILRQMGPAAMRYIYEPLKAAADKELKLSEEMQKELNALFGKYSKKEVYEMRTKAKYKFGTSNITKERLIMIGLNWGTYINMKRVMDGFNISSYEVNEALSNLEERDWNFIEGIWALYEKHWPEVQAVEARITGAVLEKQEPMPVDVLGKDGNRYHLKGGYFPLKYDPTKNSSVAEREEDVAKQASMAGFALGTGRSMTKERSMGNVKLKIDLHFEVISKTLTDEIHLISFREPVMDVRRIILNDEFAELVRRLFGINTEGMLRQWSSDCWALEPKAQSGYERAMSMIRGNMTMAVLGYRTMTAVLNILNITPMAHYLGGPAEAVRAIKRFYAHPKEQYEYIVQQSVFMAERAQTMDVNIREAVKRGTTADIIPGYKAVQDNAFKIIAMTDLSIAMPLWLHEYEKAYQSAVDNGLRPESAKRDAIMAGDAAVRRVFGSSQKIDLSAVQRGSEVMKMLTMYYSYFSTLYNALSYSFFQARQQVMHTKIDSGGWKKAVAANKKKLVKGLAPLAYGYLMWVLIPSLLDTLFRTAADDDDDKWAIEKLTKKTGKNIISNTVGGIPILRDAIPFLTAKAFDEPQYGMGSLPAYGTVEQLNRVINSIESDKKTKYDVARETLRLGGTAIGFSQTLSDGLVTTAEWAGNDFEHSLAEYLKALLLDKRLEKK